MTPERLRTIRRHVEDCRAMWATGPTSWAFTEREELLAFVDWLLAERQNPAAATNAALQEYREVPNQGPA